MGLVPGLMAPTSNINVTLGCALTTWVYYHYQGIRAQGIGPYLMHFAAPPGAPLALAPIMLPIELISHLSRVMSLSLRLFGNIFGEELVILILFTLIPWLVPLPMMLLGLVTGGLQAFIFMLLSIIYLQGAVAVEHEHDEHGHDAPHGSTRRRRRRSPAGSFQSFGLCCYRRMPIVSKRSVVTLMLMLIAGAAAPLYAQEAAAAAPPDD